MRALRRFIDHNAPPLEHFTPRARPSQAGGTARLAGAALVAALAAAPQAAQGPETTLDLEQTLLRVGARIEQWYARAQAVVSTETVFIQPLRADLTPFDFPRRLAFELRVAWDPERAGSRGVPEANVLRDILSVNGRPPQDNDDPGCIDPRPVSPEPLGILLPARRGESEFSFAGRSRVDGRDALMIDYRGVATQAPDVRWTEECVTVALPGRSRGRIWVDAANYDVLRMDDRLVGTFEFDVPREYVRRGAASSMVVERAESSIRYKSVQFSDPQETLMLPSAIDSLTVIRGGGMQRFRVSQRFTDYRRFLTGSRLLY